MAEERTLGLARARVLSEPPAVASGPGPSKEELERRMEEARDSISHTVTEIKDTVTQQYETVKDALDWREHYKKQPVAWTLGAAGVGFFVGYGIAAALTDDGDKRDYVSAISGTSRRPLISETVGAASAQVSATTNGHHEGPGLIERFRETSAYDRLSREAGSLGDRLVEELSNTAQTVVLPLLLNKIKGWIGVDLSDKSERRTSNGASMGAAETRSTPDEASGERAS